MNGLKFRGINMNEGEDFSMVFLLTKNTKKKDKRSAYPGPTQLIDEENDELIEKLL